MATAALIVTLSRRAPTLLLKLPLLVNVRFVTVGELTVISALLTTLAVMSVAGRTNVWLKVEGRERHRS